MRTALATSSPKKCSTAGCSPIIGPEEVTEQFTHRLTFVAGALDTGDVSTAHRTAYIAQKSDTSTIAPSINIIVLFTMKRNK